MTKYASGKKALAICDRCGGTFKLAALTRQYIKQRDSGLLVCRSCLDVDHPQLMLGTTPIYDPQALWNPRSDVAQRAVSRDTQWGWGPVGGGNALAGTPNALAMTGHVGQVAISLEQAP